MASTLRTWVDFRGTGAVQNDVRLAATIGATEHLRHVRISGSMIFLPYPTNVLSDNGCFWGVLAVFPAAAPPVPSFANANTWKTGWWGRPVIDSVEMIATSADTYLRNPRYNFHIEFDYSPEGAGTAGALYVGFQQMFVDANHVSPIVGYTTHAWGIVN